MTSLFKEMFQHRAELLSGVPRHEKAVMCLKERIHVLDKLPSGVSYSAIGHEFNVKLNEVS